MDELDAWLRDPRPARFPFQRVVGEFHRTGKHFVGTELLEELDAARKALVGAPLDADRRLLADFLDTALDKWDGRYDYPSYIGLPLLPLPVPGGAPEPLDADRRRADRLLVQLVTDLLGFELDAAGGRVTVLPEMRPAPDVVVKRCRLGVRAAAAASGRLGLAAPAAGVDPTQAAARLRETVGADLSPTERLVLRLSVLPVYVSHDEYLFIRVLQTFETTFATLGVHLDAATAALAAADPAGAVARIDAAGTALVESAPLFSLVATMQVAAFRTFRAYTDGASAIQSRNYKIAESLCRRPADGRLESVAYRSVPEVRDRVLAGPPTLEDAYAAARASGALDQAELRWVATAMGRFAGALGRWRRTHYRLAVRMLGERRGTGYTEGTGYLRSVREIPVFGSVAEAPVRPELEPED